MGSKSPSVRETAEEKELAKIAGERWKFYQEQYSPKIDQFIEKARMTDEDYEYGRAEVMSGAGAAIAQQNQSLLSQRGFNPNSDASFSAMSALNNASNVSESVNNVDHQIDSLHYRGLDTVAKLGKGIQTSAINGLSEVANNAANRASNEALDRFNNRMANQHAAMSLAGAGASAYGGMGKPKTGMTPMGDSGAHYSSHMPSGYFGIHD